MLLSSCFTPALAQTFREATGRISDAMGAAIPAANITFTNIATDAVRSAVSTDFLVWNPDAFVEALPSKENHRLHFRLDAFNILNRPNCGLPTLDILSGAAQPGLAATAAHQNFGVVTSMANAMRQLQLDLKYSF